jgi:hypothetical protein
MARLVDVGILVACGFAAFIALLFLRALPSLELSPISIPVFIVFVLAWLAFPIALLMWVRTGRGLAIGGFYSFVSQPPPADEAERTAWLWGRRILRAWQTGLAAMFILAAIEMLSGHWHYVGP